MIDPAKTTGKIYLRNWLIDITFIGNCCQRGIWNLAPKKRISRNSPFPPEGALPTPNHTLTKKMWRAKFGPRDQNATWTLDVLFLVENRITKERFFLHQGDIFSRSQVCWLQPNKQITFGNTWPSNQKCKSVCAFLMPYCIYVFQEFHFFRTFPARC